VSSAAALAALIYGLSLIAEGESRWPLGGAFVAFGLLCGIGAVVHARRHRTPLLDFAAATIPTFSLSSLTAGFAARVAISMTPYLLPLMFQIGFGASPLQAGIMLLVYMVGNLSMKSITTPLLHRFGFRDVIRVNGTLCALSLLACGLLSPSLAAPIVYFVLLVAGMTRSMNFTSMSTLAFADVPPPLRAGATTLAAMSQQAASTMGVAAAALALGLFQATHGATELVARDFRYAFFAASALMGLATLWSLRLRPDAGAELARKG
jgi:MFS family permease